MDDRADLVGGGVPCHVVAAAWDALAAGDRAEALAILSDALEADGAQRRRYVCESCGLAFEWPGLLDHHRLVSCALETRSRRVA